MCLPTILDRNRRSLFSGPYALLFVVLHVHQFLFATGPTLAGQSHALITTRSTYFMTGDSGHAQMRSADLQRAVAAMSSGDWAGAQRLLNRIISRDPVNIEARYYRVVSLARRFESFPAIDFQRAANHDYEWIISHDSLYRDVHYQYALLHYFNEEFEAAIKLAEKQARLHPHLWHVKHGLFELYRAYALHEPLSKSVAWLHEQNSALATFQQAEVYRFADSLRVAEAILHGLRRSRHQVSPQAISIALAKLYYSEGDSEKAQEQVYKAIDEANDRFAAELLFDVFKYLMTPDELIMYRGLDEPAAFRKLFRSVLAKRDPLPGSSIDYRLQEHFRRFVFGEQNYAYTGPSRWHFAAESSRGITFPPAYVLNNHFDDRGLMFIRFGEPTDRVVTLMEIEREELTSPFFRRDHGWVEIEGWKYTDANLHFLYTRAGPASPWRLSMSLPFHHPTLNQFAHWGGIYAHLSQTAEIIEDLRRRGDINPRTLRNIEMDQLQYSREQEKMVQESMVKGLATDRHTWNTGVQGFHVPFVLSTFRGHESNSVLVIHYLLPQVADAQELRMDAQPIHAELGFAAHDDEWNPVARYAGRTPLTFTNGDLMYHVGSFEVELPPASYNLGIHLRPETTSQIAAYRIEHVVPEYHLPRLSLSDVLPAYRILPKTQSVKGRSDLDITANPSSRFRKAESMSVYFEIYNLTYDEAGSTNYSVEYTLSGKPPSSMLKRIFQRAGPVLSLKVQQTGFETAPVEYSEIDITAIPAGLYTFSVRVVDLNGGADIHKSRSIEITM